MTFDDAFETLIGHEGGYVWHKEDPGGETKFGITKRTYPHLNIHALTLEQAKAIYRRDFWLKAGCDKLPDGVDFDVFDLAVNSGIGRAAQLLQMALGVTPDGSIGTKTLAAIDEAQPAPLRARLNGYRLLFMTDLATWKDFGKGWARRVAKNLVAIK